MRAVASLTMYDWPEVSEARSALWARIRDGLRARGVAAPDALSSQAAWRDPALVFSQTCGWPWATAYRDALDLVAVPVAECAAIDSVCWAMAQRFEADAVAHLRVVHVTAPAPALPFVTRKGGPVAAVHAALEEAIAEGLGAPLLIRGLAEPDPARYDSLPGRVATAPPLF